MKKTIVLGVSGGIAAFKTIQLVSDLVKKGYDVQVLLTEHAKEFVTPLTYETLTKHHIPDMFDRVAVYDVEHISIAKKADVFMLAPATANIIAKVAHGIADDMVTTTFLAATCPKIIAPAMNTAMYDNSITQENLALCKKYGMQIVEPTSGLLACGDMGRGKLADNNLLMDALEQALWQDRCLAGKHVVVTAGPTQEAMDPVRFISNHSSGKMGFAIAKMAHRCGAKVTLIAGPNNQSIPYGITYIPVRSACEMFEAVKQHHEADVIVKAAAVGDYRTANQATEKIKKTGETLTIELVKNPDILKWLGEHRLPHQVICGFAMETEHIMEHAMEKLKKKNADMIVVNDLREQGAGFQVDSNRVNIIFHDHVQKMELMSKEDLAYELCKIFCVKAKEKEIC